MIVHVDMSKKFYQKTTVGIAWTDSKRNVHKGMALSGGIIKQLIKDFSADHDFPRLYAICIYLITREIVNDFTKIIICNDEPFEYVKEYLRLLYDKDSIRNDMKIISLTEYRYELGEKKIKSLADGLANSYRKRALKPNQWNKGVRNLI